MNTIAQAEARAAEMRASWQARPNAVTPKGLAVVAIYQIKRALIDMDAADRDEVREMVADMLNDDRARVIFGAALVTHEG